jgi:hypothetical protein
MLSRKAGYIFKLFSFLRLKQSKILNHAEKIQLIHLPDHLHLHAVTKFPENAPFIKYLWPLLQKCNLYKNLYRSIFFLYYY